MPEDEQPKKIDVFEIGLYAIEVATIAAIVYAIFAFPVWLKPVTL